MDFVGKVIDMFDVSQSTSHVGVIMFSYQTRVRLAFICTLFISSSMLKQNFLSKYVLVKILTFWIQSING